MVCRFAFSDVSDRARAFISRFPSGLFRNTDLLTLAATPGGSPAPDSATFSPPLGVQSDGYLQCAAVNLTNADVSVHYALDDGNGAIVAMVDTTVPAELGKGALAMQNLDGEVCTFRFDTSPKICAATRR